MPFTSPAGLCTDTSTGEAEPVPGFSLVFETSQMGWILDWYDDTTGIQLPSTFIWLEGARAEHRWIGTFAAARGARVPRVEDGARVQLILGGKHYEVERIGDLQWAPGAPRWLVLAGTGDPPDDPTQAPQP